MSPHANHIPVLTQHMNSRHWHLLFKYSPPGASKQAVEDPDFEDYVQRCNHKLDPPIKFEIRSDTAKVEITGGIFGKMVQTDVYHLIVELDGGSIEMTHESCTVTPQIRIPPVKELKHGTKLNMWFQFLVIAKLTSRDNIVSYHSVFTSKVNILSRVEQTTGRHKVLFTASPLST
jgi:hypothetical protein